MYNLQEAYLEIYESRKGMPGELRPTVMPKSREQNIGKFDDWKHQTPDTWEGQTAEEKQAARLKSRANAVVQTQRRQDREVGIRKEELEYYDIILDYLLDEGYADTEESANKIILVMSEEWKNTIIQESDSSEIAKLRRQMSDALRKNDQATVKKIAARLAELAPGTKAKIGAALNKDKPDETTTKDTSKPQTPKGGVVSGLSSPTLRSSLARSGTAIINSIPDNPDRPARMSTHVDRSGNVVSNISQDTESGIDQSKYINQTRSERRRPARQQTPRRGETGFDPNRPITTRNKTD